ncbi:hypothetical protein CK203_072185 [Vitis vinifera]|uniref:Reverse transcriptase Ty1/copia-type domain-containing protein n=1 Tax=Vitis vinifera TaxID=29760 RepID=A0A438BV21_VITVI|nr:hypothetical protein CK203_072185 [Vitis vinifera]
MLSTHFDMKDLGEASYVLGIKILRDRANGVLKLSQRAYIEKILKRFNMHNCSLMYAQVCTRPDIAFVVGMLGRYLSNPGSLDDKKSTTGYIFMMAGGAVSWKVSSRHLQHPQLWRQSMWHVMRLVVMLSVAFSKNTRSISRSKHIDVKFYFVKEKESESLIDIEHMSTKSMLADPLTKGLPIIAFQEHVSQMGLLEA